MKRVYKYRIEDLDVLIPEGAEFCHLGFQGDELYIWFLVDPAKPVKARKFRIHGTGSPISDDRKFIGTVFDGPFVWHVFELVD